MALTTSGQIIIGGSSGPAAATLTAGSNITISNGDGSITIAASGGGTGMTLTMVVASNATTSLVVVNPGQGYAAGDTVTFTNQNSQTNSLVLTIDVVKETLGGIPIEYINTTHNAGTSVSGSTSAAKIMSDMDEYLITIPDATMTCLTTETNATKGTHISKCIALG